VACHYSRFPVLPCDTYSIWFGRRLGLATAAVLRRLGLIVLEEDAEAGVLTLSPDEISRWSRSAHNRRGLGLQLLFSCRQPCCTMRSPVSKLSCMMEPLPIQQLL
jgi:hypothetical protein